MSDYGIKITKEGSDVATAGYNELEMTSQVDTMKIFGTDTLTITFPVETWYHADDYPGDPGDNDYESGVWDDLQEDSYAHSLGYVPVYSPGIFDSTVWWYYVDSPSSPFSLNEISDFLVPQVGPWGIGGLSTQVVGVVADTSNIYLRVRRISWPMSGFPIEQTADTYTVNIVVYYNDATTEFDYL